MFLLVIDCLLSKKNEVVFEKTVPMEEFVALKGQLEISEKHQNR